VKLAIRALLVAQQKIRGVSNRADADRRFYQVSDSVPMAWSIIEAGLFGAEQIELRLGP
jgi:hypothetical protein